MDNALEELRAAALIRAVFYALAHGVTAEELEEAARVTVEDAVSAPWRPYKAAVARVEEQRTASARWTEAKT